jgi:hypothetical protein
VEQELLILPEKMSSPKVLMRFILLDLQFPVSWGGGANPPFYIGPRTWTDISRASGILKGPVVQEFYWPYGQLIFFLKSTPGFITQVMAQTYNPLFF